MARDGSGTWNAPEAAVVTATPISSTSYNSTIADLGAALTQSISKDGQTVPTADLPMGTYKHSGVGTGTARTHYTALGQAQDAAFIWGGTAGGTAPPDGLDARPPRCRRTDDSEHRERERGGAPCAQLREMGRALGGLPIELCAHRESQREHEERLLVGRHGEQCPR